QGPGPLKSLHLAGVATFADFSLSQAVEDLPHPQTDTEQDEVWLGSGDQLLGQVTHAGRQGIDLHGHFGEKTLPWGEVRGLYLRRGTPAPQTTVGEHVRVRLWPGVGSEADELEGVVEALDDQHLVLQHAILGRCDIDRSRLQELRWLF